MSILTRNNRCIIFIIIALLLLWQCSLRHTSIPPEIPITDLHSADIALRLGRTMQSEAIARYGEAGYSHIGIIILTDSLPFVVHIEPESRGNELIRTEPITTFFHPDRAIAGCVMRHEKLNDSLRHVISSYALQLARRSISFDHDYLISDSTRMYCTELTERIFDKVGISLSQGKRDRLPLAKEPVIMPSAIYENKSLCVVWSYRID